jgi:actin-like ATPase involved in cell morphogenesis
MSKGLDPGTGNFVVADDKGIRLQRNSFLTLTEVGTTTRQLKMMNVPYVVINQKINIIGTKAYELANVFNSSELKRPMSNGLLNPMEQDALPVLQLIINELLGSPSKENELVTYCIPGKPIDRENEVSYHEDVLKTLITNAGYSAKSINEAYALGLIGLEDAGYTGIAISCGAGMCNICIMYAGIPALTFSTSKAGDFISENVARDCGITKAKATYIKEKGDYSISPKAIEIRSREQQAIKTYYEVLIRYLLANIEKQFTSTQMPTFPNAVPIVCGGGTTMVNGFIEVFKDQFNQKGFPIDISDITLVKEPLTAVARGCLKDAELED